MSVAIGRVAENWASRQLETQGYTVLQQNWRTKLCEIDIVALSPRGMLVFIEVKYRRSVVFGSGLDYITRDKLGRMKRAAFIWLTSYDYRGDYRLAALEVSGAGSKMCVIE